jgi:hypothetical protein
MNSYARRIAGFLLAAAALGPLSKAHAQSADQAAALETFLRSARILSVDKGGLGGRTSPWIATLSDGTVERKAIFKYVDRRRPQLLPDSFRYELAAYELSKIIGLPIVPPVVERAVEGVPGSLQIFLEDCLRFRELKQQGRTPPDSDRFLSALAEIRIFENLVYNECGNLEDTLVHLEDWRICRVDFSEAFSPEPELIPGCAISRCSRTLYDALKALDAPRLRAALAPFLNEVEIDAMAARLVHVVAAVDRLVREAGEESVLFGPPAGEARR